MIKRRKKGMPDVPVSSFSDIAFLLIIFFILAAELQQRRYGFNVELPSGQEGQAQEQKTNMISVKAGQVAFNGAVMSMDELRQNLFGLELATKTLDEDKIVMLESAPGVSYQDYFETMSVINAAGGVIAIVREEKD